MFFLSIKMLLHCLLVCLSDERANIIFVLLCVIWVFFLAAFQTHFNTGFRQFDHDVLWCRFLHISFTWDSLSLVDLWV